VSEFEVSFLRKLCIPCVSAVIPGGKLPHPRDAECADVALRLQTSTYRIQELLDTLLLA
jgi:hypothetical protein